MAAKGKKKQRSRKNQKTKKQSQNAPLAKAEEEEPTVEEVENESSTEFDLEAMERMLAEDEKESDDDDDGKNVQSKEESDDFEDESDEVKNVGEEDGSDNEGESGTEDESEDEYVQVEEANNNNNNDSRIPSINEGDESCTIDLRNLLAINSHQVNIRSLYKKQKNKDKNEEEDEDSTTICIDGAVKANETYLLQKAMEGCSQLLSGLWSLETEKSDAGPMAVLPTYCEIVTPRELPPPTQKAETKWEKFAKERGIAPKEKRSRKVWDEATQSWAYRTGYQKATSMDDPESWPIMEVKRNDDPFENPWQRARDAKKERVEKNTMNRMKNAETGGVIERGTARRVMKGKKEAREKGRIGGNMDLKNFTNSQPSGIPTDLVKGKQRGKSLTKMALLATQTSTASMGKFDKMREGEPERKKSMSGLKKRKYESATSESVVKAESRKSLKVLENVISGGGKAKDRDIRRGQYAKGETGHDYDFDDGLGPSTYKKKKGRAGIGKMRKITKKMAK